MNFQLTTEQLAAINTNESRVLVEACAGSGKTAVLTQRVGKLVDDGVEPSLIVAITFTNAAADNMIKRLGDKATGVFIGTVHSYANYLLLSYGIDTSDYLEQENFDALFDLVQKNTSCIKPVKHLLVDEAQDSTRSQFQLFELIKPENFFYVFDFRQSIFRWNGADPDYIIDMTHDVNNVVYHLSGNYRCKAEILNYARNIIRLCGYDYSDKSIAMRGSGGTVIDVDFSAEGIVNGIKKNGEPGDWFVICRKNEEVMLMCNALAKAGVPYDTFKKKDLTASELNERLSSNKVKVLTIHAAKGLENKNVAVVGVKFYSPEEKCIAYVAATRARDMLVWTKTKPVKKKDKNLVNWE